MQDKAGCCLFVTRSLRGKGLPEQALVNKGLASKAQGVSGTSTGGVVEGAALSPRRDLVTGLAATERKPSLTSRSSVWSQADTAFGPRVPIVAQGAQADKQPERAGLKSSWLR